MTKLLLITHGYFGEDLLSTARLMLGPQEGVRALSLKPEAGREDLSREAAAELESLGGQALILVDLLGGTPWNVAFLLSVEKGHEVLSGLSLPLLLEALSLRAAMGAQDLGAALQKSGPGFLALGSALFKGAQKT